MRFAVRSGLAQGGTATISGKFEENSSIGVGLVVKCHSLRGFTERAVARPATWTTHPCTR
jgi:hypothetical protein